MFGAKVVFTVMKTEVLVVGAVVNAPFDTAAVRDSLSATKHAVSNGTMNLL